MSGRTGLLIGLTGGIGSGKSTAAARFASLGARVLDADAVSRKLLDVDGGCYQQVVETFGTDILLPGGAIDRKALAAVVFADVDKRGLLNAIVHPAVNESLLTQARLWTDSAPDTPVVLDVPLLFECGMERQVDTTVLVYAPEEVRIDRILQRDGCTRAEAVSRINAQMSLEEKRLLADAVLDNGGDRASLYAQVDALYRRLTAVES